MRQSNPILPIFVAVMLIACAAPVSGQTEEALIAPTATPTVEPSISPTIPAASTPTVSSTSTLSDADILRIRQMRQTAEAYNVTLTAYASPYVPTLMPTATVSA